MRRSPLRRLTPLASRTPLKRTGRLKTKGQTHAEKKWREAALDKAGHRCQYPSCTRTEGLEANHVNSRAQRPDLKLDPDNSSVLCWEHHRLITDNPAHGTELGFVRHDRYENRGGHE